MSANHLDVIDGNAWPAVAELPRPVLGAVRSRAAEAQFASALNKAGLTASRDGDLTVVHEGLFARLSAAGWTGLAESFLAGEWTADDLSAVLAAFIDSGFRPRTPKITPDFSGVGELPPDLVRLFAGDGMSAHAGIFSSAVPTTVREAVPSYVPGAGRGREPGHHFVDVCTFAPPALAERADLGDAQGRAAELLLDAAQVRTGTHVLEYPSSGGAVAVAAALRKAAVDTLTGDVDLAAAVKERLTLAGVGDSVQTVVRDSVLTGAKDWRSRYDAIVSVEKLETVSPDQRVDMIRGIDRMLEIGGRAAIQITVATEKMSPAARDALRVLTHYIWPGLDYPTMTQLHQLVDKNSGLRIVAQTHAGTHAQLSLEFQASLFDGHKREAAAEGFDAVYRRLWDYQFALRRALFSLGMLDTVQIELTHRNRGGRR